MRLRSKIALLGLLATLLYALPAQATTYYVSNAATNGFAVGSDSNNTTQAQSKSTPYLTVVHALSVAVSGDDIRLNAGTFAETSGSGYLCLNVNYASTTTIEGDDGLNDAIITGASSASDNIVCGSPCNNVTLKNLSVNYRVNTNQQCLRFSGNTSNLTLTNVNFNLLLNNDAIPRYGVLFNTNTAGITLTNINVSGGTMTSTGMQGTATTWGYLFDCTKGARNALTGCTINGVTINNVVAGIGAKSIAASGLTISNSTVSAGSTGSYAGVGYGLIAGVDGVAPGYTTTLTLVNDYFQSGANTHACLLGGGSTNCTVNNCSIVNFTGGANSHALVLKECTNNTVANCYLQSSSGVLTTCYFKAATGCRVTYSTVTTSGASYGVKAGKGDTGDKCSNCTFSNNLVIASGSSTIGLYWDGATAGSEDSGGSVVNFNVYNFQNSASARVRGATVLTTLAAIQAAWGGLYTFWKRCVLLIFWLTPGTTVAVHLSTCHF